MKCPECGFEDSKVIDSRPTDGKIRRRRECLSCKCRFTTYEIVENIPLMVVKKDHSIEPFDSQKLVERLLRAAVKRPIGLETIEGIVDEIESELKNSLVKAQGGYLESGVCHFLIHPEYTLEHGADISETFGCRNKIGIFYVIQTYHSFYVAFL